MHMNSFHLTEIKRLCCSVVLVPKGLNLFALHAMKNISGDIEEPCPACSKSTKMEGMGFYKCIWEAWGGSVCKAK